MKDIYRAMIDKLSMTGSEPERKQILNSASLKRKQCVLVFDSLEEGTDLHIEFLAFLDELYQWTDHLKIIVLVEKPELLQSAVDENFQRIELKNLDIDDAMEYLSFIIQTERKQSYVTEKTKEELK